MADNLPDINNAIDGVGVAIEDPEVAVEATEVAAEATEPLKIGEWVVAQFELANKKSHSFKYVAQIEAINDVTNEFRLDCLRPKITRSDSGYIYTYPNIRDKDTFVKKCDIIRRLENPVKCQRALKFSVHSEEI